MNSIDLLKSECATALTRWLASSKDFREAYGEVDGLLGLPNLEEDEPTPGILQMIERAFETAIDRSGLSVRSLSKDEPDEMWTRIRRELSPPTSLEADSYGPDGS